MRKETATVMLQNGLEARPIAVLVQLASQFECKVYLETEGKRVNAKSIMGMMNLVLVAGTTITIDVVGDDEKEALEGIENFLLNLENE